MRTVLARLVAGLGLVALLSACGHLPTSVQVAGAEPSVTPIASSPTGASAPSQAQTTPAPPTFHFDSTAIDQALAGTDAQLSDVDTSLHAADASAGGEGAQP